MKKFLLLAGVAATALTSCNNEEVIDVVADDTITFRTSMALNQAGRGAETTTPSMMQFKTTAIEQTKTEVGTLFNGVIFKKVSGSNEYKSAKSYLWYKGANLKFYAWSYCIDEEATFDDSKVGEISINQKEAKIKNFSPQAEIADQIDLVGAATLATYDSDRKAAVGLTFAHLLSEIQVKALTESDVYTFSVKGVKYCNIASVGTYDYEAAEGADPWTRTADKTSYGVKYLKEPITLEKTAKNISRTAVDGFAQLIPQPLDKWDPATDRHNEAKGAYIAVLLQIRTIDTGMQVFPLTRQDASGNAIDNEGRYAWACIPISDTWERGHRITYVLNFTNGAGYTDPDPEDPDDPDDPDNPVKPDPDDEGKPILDGLVKYTVVVEDWIDDDPIDKKWDASK